LVGVKAFNQLNAQRAQLVAHRGVNARVTAGDPMPGFTRQSRQTTHEGATNAQNMYMHAGIVGGQVAAFICAGTIHAHERCCA
jgi:hypothetical protein